MCSKMAEGRKMTSPRLAFNLGMVSAIMALVDLSLCSLYLRGIEDLKNSSHIEVPAFYPILNEGICLLYAMQGLVSSIQYVACALLFYKNDLDHPYWFFVWLTIFTAFFVLYLRVMFTATLFHESIPVDHVLAKGILSSALNVYFLLISLYALTQHTQQRAQLTDVKIF